MIMDLQSLWLRLKNTVLFITARHRRSGLSGRIGLCVMVAASRPASISKSGSIYRGRANGMKSTRTTVSPKRWHAATLRFEERAFFSATRRGHMLPSTPPKAAELILIDDLSTDALTA